MAKAVILGFLLQNDPDEYIRKYNTERTTGGNIAVEELPCRPSRIKKGFSMKRIRIGV